MDMDIDKLAQSAVEVVATHLAQWGTDAADRLADEGINQIYQLILSRLRRTSDGLGMLTWLQHDPVDEHRRAAVTQVVTGEARNDPEFAESLGQAVQRAGILVQGAGASYRSGDNTVEFQNIVTQGDVRIGHRQFHIGRLQIGTGGLVTGIIGLVVLLGGGTAAVVSATAVRRVSVPRSAGGSRGLPTVSRLRKESNDPDDLLRRPFHTLRRRQDGPIRRRQLSHRVPWNCGTDQGQFHVPHHHRIVQHIPGRAFFRRPYYRRIPGGSHTRSYNADQGGLLTRLM
jgi:hypothetical protein